MADTIATICKVCGETFHRPIQRGRPAVRCEKCRAEGKLPPTDKETIGSFESEPSSAPYESPEVKEDYSPTTYRVLVGGGLGTVYSGDSEKDALSLFFSYEKKSTYGFGQVGFEAVQMWKLNKETNSYDLVRSYDPAAERARDMMEAED